VNYLFIPTALIFVIAIWATKKHPRFMKQWAYVLWFVYACILGIFYAYAVGYEKGLEDHGYSSAYLLKTTKSWKRAAGICGCITYFLFHICADWASGKVRKLEGRGGYPYF
jgi:hypothetical protein